MLSKIVQKRPSLLVTTFFAWAIASSDICFLSHSIVWPETERPMLLSIKTTREPVPLILKKRPRPRGRMFVAWLWTKMSIVIAANTAYRFG